MQIQESPPPSRAFERREILTRAHNLMQIQLIEESGMDVIEWIEQYGEVFRDAVTESADDDPRSLFIKPAIERACLLKRIDLAVNLVKRIHTDFPIQKAA